LFDSPQQASPFLGPEAQSPSFRQLHVLLEPIIRQIHSFACRFGFDEILTEDMINKRSAWVLVHYAETAQWLERERTDRKVRRSNPTSASQLLLSRFGQLGSIQAFVVPSGDKAARHRKGATAERLRFFFALRCQSIQSKQVPNTLICKLIRFRKRLTWNPAESLACDVSRQLSVLRQAASCFSRYDIRDIAIHGHS
ncbi:hypothetical protein T265_13378, partial [Opisthorchis viverrini]